MSQNILYIVVPCYNEEEVLEETTRRLVVKLNQLINTNEVSSKSKIVYINDGSKDDTWNIIDSLHKSNKQIQGLKLSNNKGHQFALLAGLMYAKDYADMIISMDADLQDDINAVDEFIKKYKAGNDIVYGVRSSRKKDSFFKRFSATSFYKLLKFMGVDIIYNHADYRLMSKRAVIALAQYEEVNLFLRGIVPLIGYQTDIVYYERNERFAGVSKYPLKKMLSFAMVGITSFSIKPIRLITTLGLITFIISLFMLCYFLTVYLLGRIVPGWTTIVVSVWGIGGIQLLSIGIIGEYIGKMYLETKSRPKFLIDKILEDNNE